MLSENHHLNVWLNSAIFKTTVNVLMNLMYLMNLNNK